MPIIRDKLKEMGFELNRRSIVDPNSSEPISPNVDTQIPIVSGDPKDNRNLQDKDIMKLIGYVELGSVSTTISITGFEPKDNLMIMFYSAGFSVPSIADIIFNGDTGAHYSYIAGGFTNGGWDVSSSNNVQSIRLGNVNVLGTDPSFVTINITNKLGQVKILNGHGGSNTGSLTLCNSNGVWNDTASRITSVKFSNQNGANYSVGTYIKIFGN